MRTPDKKRLDDYVQELFSEVPLTLRALRMETSWQGEKIESVRFTPSIAGDQAGRLRQLLDLTGEKLPIIFPTAGFFPRVGMAYQTLVRFKPSRSGRGGVVLAFPAERRKLRASREWRPGLHIHAGKMTFQHLQEQVWMSRHPETGQVVLTWRHVKMEKPRRETVTNPKTHKEEVIEVCDLDMSPYVLRPAHTSGHWVAGNRRELETLDEGALTLYDEVLAEEQVQRDRRFTPGAPAPESEMFGTRLTPFEIYGTPEPAPLTQPDQLVKNVAAWVKRADRWRRQGLVFALHEDRFPEDWGPDPDKGPEAAATRALALRLAEQARQAAEAAYDWIESLAVHLDRKLAALRASGLKPAKGDFALPKPKRRGTRQTPLILLSLAGGGQVGDPSLTQVFRDLVRHGGQWPVKKPAAPQPSPAEAPTGPAEQAAKGAVEAAKPTKRPAKKGKLAPPRRQPGRVIASVGSEAGGDTAVSAAMRRAVAQLPEPETPPTTKPRKTYYFGHCPICGRRIRTPNPELSGKVIPGTPCRKCAKNAKKKK